MSFEIVSAATVPAEVSLRALIVAPELLENCSEVGIQSEWLAAAGFEGKAGQTYATQISGQSVIAIGIGPLEQADLEALRRAAAAAGRAGAKHGDVSLELPAGITEALDVAEVAHAVAEGLVLATYRYTEFKSKAEPSKLEKVVVVGASEDGLRRGKASADAVNMARDLVNGPPGKSTPKRLAAVAGEVAEAHGLEIKVLDEVDIEREGLGGLRGVSLGSDEPPRLIEMTYEPDGEPTATIALVGKGITFDSGGLSLKPANGMMTMKTDMSGAAAVIAAMSVIGSIRPKAKVIGIVAATENLPGPKATKPGDVLTARNGKTMEVLNTDAEGRLVLADGLSLAVEAGVDAIVDVATLTGACVVALGNEIAGLMTNNDELGGRVSQAADTVGEAVWKLPLPLKYRKHIDSDVADIKNIGAGGGAAGSLTAGLFLKEFVGETPWVHLDIAGPARADSDDGYIVKGGTGFGVRTLVSFVESYD